MVVPVQLRLGVEPVRAPGARGDLAEHLGRRLAAVGARIAEHDDRGPRVQVVLDQRAKLAPDAPVVGVAADVGDARVLADRRVDGLEVAFLLEDVGDLADPLDEDERAHLAERVVHRVHDREEEHGRARDAR